MDTIKKKRYLYFDVMNVLACLGVVIMHHNTHMHSFDGSRSWILSLAVECLLYWNVPVFIMMSGANLLGYHTKYDTGTFFRKRILRTLIPWLIWSVIILLWKIGTHQMSTEGRTVSDLISLILTNNAEGIYWFFTNIFGCYLLTPGLTYLTPHKKALWYGVVLIFILSLIEPLVALWLPLSHAGVVALENSLIIYYILGYLLNNTEFTKKQRILIYLAGLCAVLFRFSYACMASFAAQATDLTVRGNKMCNTVICACAAFVFFKQVNWEKLLPDFVRRILPKLASCSLGVYLLHKVVIYHLREFTGLPLQSICWKLLFPFVTWLICVCVIACLRKIPFLKKFIC